MDDFKNQHTQNLKWDFAAGQTRISEDNFSAEGEQNDASNCVLSD